MNQRFFSFLGASALSLALVACQADTASPAGSNLSSAPALAQVMQLSIRIQPYEFGPAVDRVILSLTEPASALDTSQLNVKTAGVTRQVVGAYLSTASGEPLAEGEHSKYATVTLDVTYEADKFSTPASPFYYNLETFRNEWQQTYPVEVSGLAATVNGQAVQLAKSEDAISHRLSPATVAFNIRESFSGVFDNPWTQSPGTVTLHYAAYQPDSLKDGAKNPLLIWLHGQGEGGTDTDITLLGNEVTALAGQNIQARFTAMDAPDEVGAYVLAVQTPTYWMDEGDGTNGAGAGVSRYTEALKGAIDQYVASNPDIDTSRIYLAGCSNGGYMTLNMALHYPEMFAALAPSAPAYAYYDFERQADGTYAKSHQEGVMAPANIKLETVYFDQAKIDILKNIPTWFIHSANDTTVVPEDYILPVYKALVDNGADNTWLSYYESVPGHDIPATQYMGHWSWIYYFNDQVSGVQEVQVIRDSEGLTGFVPSNASLGGPAQAVVEGVSYDNIFDWLNAQHK